MTGRARAAWPSPTGRPEEFLVTIGIERSMEGMTQPDNAALQQTPFLEGFGVIARHHGWPSSADTDADRDGTGAVFGRDQDRAIGQGLMQASRMPDREPGAARG
jgi:hypothetical protein